MTNRFKNKICYYCGQPATSDEHVPPKQLFKDFEFPRFTVPSCEKHNTDKHSIDAAIIKSLLMSSDNTRYRPRQTFRVQLLMERTRPYYSEVKRLVTYKPFLNSAPEYPLDFPVTLPSLDENIDVDLWITQMTAGLIFAGVKKYYPDLDWQKTTIFAVNIANFDKVGPYSPSEIMEWREFSERIRADFETGFLWEPGWRPDNTAYPIELFQFRIAIRGNQVAVHLRFLENFNWYVTFEASAQTISDIRDALDKSKERQARPFRSNS